MRRFQVIQGGKGEKRDSSGLVKLFKAHSISDLTIDEVVFHDVRFNWYCVEREYRGFHVEAEALIEDYEVLDDRQKSLFEKSLERCFTAQEIMELETYLREKYGMDLIAEEVPLPLKRSVGMFEKSGSVIYDFLELSERAGYYLPFKTWGYYTVQNCLSSPSLENGVRYLKKAMELLNSPMSIPSARLEAVAKALYNEEGLIVRSREEERR